MNRARALIIPAQATYQAPSLEGGGLGVGPPPLSLWERAGVRAVATLVSVNPPPTAALRPVSWPCPVAV